MGILKTNRKSLFLLLIIAVMFIGCGGGGDSTNSVSNPTPNNPSPSPTIPPPSTPSEPTQPPTTPTNPAPPSNPTPPPAPTTPESVSINSFRFADGTQRYNIATRPSHPTMYYARMGNTVNITWNVTGAANVSIKELVFNIAPTTYCYTAVTGKPIPSSNWQVINHDSLPANGSLPVTHSDYVRAAYIITGCNSANTCVTQGPIHIDYVPDDTTLVRLYNADLSNCFGAYGDPNYHKPGYTARRPDGTSYVFDDMGFQNLQGVLNIVNEIISGSVNFQATTNSANAKTIFRPVLNSAWDNMAVPYTDKQYTVTFAEIFINPNSVTDFVYLHEFIHTLLFPHTNDGSNMIGLPYTNTYYTSIPSNLINEFAGAFYNGPATSFGAPISPSVFLTLRHLYSLPVGTCLTPSLCK